MASLPVPTGSPEKVFEVKFEGFQFGANDGLDTLSLTGTIVPPVPLSDGILFDHCKVTFRTDAESTHFVATYTQYNRIYPMGEERLMEKVKSNLPYYISPRGLFKTHFVSEDTNN